MLEALQTISNNFTPIDIPKINQQESETLEAQNKTLKSEIDRLEGEKKRLMDMLSAHDPTCAKRFKEMTEASDMGKTEGNTG